MHRPWNTHAWTRMYIHHTCTHKTITKPLNLPSGCTSMFTSYTLKSEFIILFLPPTPQGPGYWWLPAKLPVGSFQHGQGGSSFLEDTPVNDSRWFFDNHNFLKCSYIATLWFFLLGGMIYWLSTVQNENLAFFTFLVSHTHNTPHTSLWLHYFC